MKLQLASEQYEASVKALLAVSEDEEQINTYTVKLTRQLAGLDTLLEKLQDDVENNYSEDSTEIPVWIDNNERIFSYMQMRVQTTEKIVNSNFT